MTVRPGHRTENISLADDAEYSLNGLRQDGAEAVVSRVNTPFIMRLRVEFPSGDQDLAQSFDVGPLGEVASTAWSVTSNVVTLTVAAGHGLAVGQYIVVAEFPTAPEAILGQFQITEITSTTVLYAATTPNASATEAGVIRRQKIRMLTQSESKVIFDSDIDDTESIIVAPAHQGVYTVHNLTGGTMAIFLVSGAPAIVEQLDVGSAYTVTNANDTTINVDISSGNIRVNNESGGSVNLRVEYQPESFCGLDRDGFMCLFERDREIVLRNRTGAARVCALESITTRPTAKVASSPNV